MAERAFRTRNVRALWTVNETTSHEANGPEHLHDYRKRFPIAHGFEAQHMGDWFIIYLHTPCVACDALGDWLAVQPNVTEIVL